MRRASTRASPVPVHLHDTDDRPLSRRGPPFRQRSSQATGSNLRRFFFSPASRMRLESGGVRNQREVSRLGPSRTPRAGKTELSSRHAGRALCAQWENLLSYRNILRHDLAEERFHPYGLRATYLVVQVLCCRVPPNSELSPGPIMTTCKQWRRHWARCAMPVGAR